MSYRAYLASFAPFLRLGRKTQQAGRKSFRPRLEALEDRTLLSITSTITLVNNSGFTLTFAGENFDNGAHDLTTRPNTIPNGATASWDVGGGSGFLGAPVGVVGTSTWNVGITGIQDTLNLDFPIVGPKHASQSLTNNSTNYFNAPDGFFGDTNSPTFTLGVNPANANFGVWASATPTIPNTNDAATLMLLLPDGSVMINGGGNNATAFASANWYQLTPNSSGSYANGNAITQLASMTTPRHYFSTQVLPNDTVFAYGGEYTNAGQVWVNSGEFFTLGQSSTTPWGALPTIPNTAPPGGPPALLPSNQYGDQNIELLNNGAILTADPGVGIAGTGSFVFNPPSALPSNQNDGNGTWTATGTTLNTTGDNEDNWVQLPNGDVLDYQLRLSNAGTASAEIYVPSGGAVPANDVAANGGVAISTGQWFNASTGAIQLTTGTIGDVGPAVLIPNLATFNGAPLNGPAVVLFGATGQTAYYDPASNTWAAGPNLPLNAGVQQTTADGPAAVLPDGEVLVALSPQVTANPTPPPALNFPGPTRLYLFNPNANFANGTNWQDVTPPDNQLAVTTTAGNCFNESMLVLPSGQILMSDSTRTLWVYTPTGTTAAAVAGAQPKITGVQIDPNTPGLFHVKGTGLNGINEGAYYGDDEEMSSNYPIVQLTDTSGNIVYATTSNWKPGFGGTGGTSVDFTLPAGTNLSQYASFTLLANGIGATTQSLNPASIDATGKLKISAYLFPDGKVTLQLKAGDPNTLQLYQGSTLFKEFPVSSINSIEVDQSSTLTLEFSNGNLIPSGGLALIGNDSDSKLILKGQLPSGPFGKEVDTAIGPHSGTITLDGSTISYQNLKPIIDTVTASNFTIQDTPNADQINIVDDPNGTENGFQATEVNSTSFEKVDFANKTNVTVDGADGADTFAVNYTNPAAGLANLKVVTGPTDGSVVNIQAIPSGMATNILSKAAATVNVGSLAPASGCIIDNINGPLVITNNVTKGTLNLDDTGSTGAKSGFLTNNSITGLGMAGSITYNGMQNVNVSLGSGNDIFNIQSTSATTTVNGGAAFDVFNVGTLAPASGGYLAQLSGKLYLNGASAGTTSMVLDDQLDPVGETFTLTNTTFASPISALVTYSKVQGIGVNAGTGNDTLVVDSSNGLVNVANGINYDGGTGFDSLQLIQTGGPTQISDTYNPGPNAGQGSDVITGPGGTESVFFQHLAPVIDLVPATTLTVNGTPANNAISYTVGSSTSRGKVAIDNLETIEFANKTNLALNSGLGTDTISLNNPNTPTALTGISVAGGDPNAKDALTVSGVAATVGVNTGTQTITGAAGTSGAVPVTYTTIAALTVNAGSSPTLAMSGSPSYVYTPGATNDAGTVQTTALPISFAGFGSANTMTVTGTGGSASLVVNGTAANDVFSVNTSALGGQIILNSQAPILTANIPTLTLNGVAGNDTFTLQPAILSSPYTTLNIQAGPPATPTGSQANLTATAGTPITLSGQTLTQGAITVTGSGLANENLNGAGNDLTYNGVAGVTENINVSASPSANQGQVSVPGVTLWTFTNVPSIAVSCNPADNDTLTFTGTLDTDIYQINLAAAGSDADPVLQLQTATGITLLTLRNYTGTPLLNISGLSGADTFNVYTAPITPGGGRQISINEQLPAGKKKFTSVLNVFWVKPKPAITHSISTQDPDAGLVSLNYGTGFASYLIQFDGISTVNISQKR